MFQFDGMALQGMVRSGPRAALTVLALVMARLTNVQLCGCFAWRSSPIRCGYYGPATEVLCRPAVALLHAAARVAQHLAQNDRLGFLLSIMLLLVYFELFSKRNVPMPLLLLLCMLC
jgi:hypothetical protein